MPNKKINQPIIFMNHKVINAEAKPVKPLKYLPIVITKPSTNKNNIRFK